MAYTADKGEKLLDIATGQVAGMGPPMTYLLDGKQYIALMGGIGAAPARGAVAPPFALPPVEPTAAAAQQALSESLFVVPNTRAQLLARWGQVPPQSTVDPNAIEPVDSPSWILDLDMFSVESQPFDPEALVAEVRTYADGSIRCFGGQ